MSRLQRLGVTLRGDRVQLLVIELLVVFLGVYGAFALQDYSERRKLDAERRKVLVGVKEDLEYFRIFFPGFTARDLIVERAQLVAEGRYRDYSDWRFLQPQYDYTALEYALDAGVGVVDYELNSGLAGIYQELQKLRHAEELMTRLAMAYRPIPPNAPPEPEIQLAHEANLNGFALLNQRAEDRAEIMDRVARLSAEVLEDVDRRFAPGTLRQVELELIRERLDGMPEGQRETYVQLISDAFPHLAIEDIEGRVR